jgi:hypothetical protein
VGDVFNFFLLKVLTENKTTQNRPKQHRARDETQKEKKICAHRLHLALAAAQPKKKKF